MRNLFVCVIAVAWTVSAHQAVRSAEPPQSGERATPEPMTFMEIAAPPGAKVFLDGQDQGGRRLFNFGTLEQGPLAGRELLVRFRSGSRVSKTLLLQQGHRYQVPVRDPQASWPELVLRTGHLGPILPVGFSPDGKWLLTTSFDSSAILWDTETGDWHRTLEGDEHGISSATFSPDGTQILGASQNLVILWDVATGARLRTFEGHEAIVEAAVFSPNGSQVLSGSWDGTAIVWDAATGETFRTLQGHQGNVTCVAFSPQGALMLTGSRDRTAILWDEETGRRLLTFEGHEFHLSSVAFSRDGRRVLTRSPDRTAILWDAGTGRAIHTFEGLYDVKISPDGSHVVTCSHDQTAILWDADSGKQLRRFDGDQRVGSVAFSVDGPKFCAVRTTHRSFGASRQDGSSRHFQRGGLWTSRPTASEYLPAHRK